MTSLSSEIHSDRKTRNHDTFLTFYHILKSSVIYFEQTHDKMETVFVKSTIEMTSNVQKSSQTTSRRKVGFYCKDLNILTSFL